MVECSHFQANSVIATQTHLQAKMQWHHVSLLFLFCLSYSTAMSANVRLLFLRTVRTGTYVRTPWLRRKSLFDFTSLVIKRCICKRMRSAKNKHTACISMDINLSDEWNTSCTCRYCSWVACSHNFALIATKISWSLNRGYVRWLLHRWQLTEWTTKVMVCTTTCFRTHRYALYCTGIVCFGAISCNFFLAALYVLLRLCEA